MKMTKSSIPTFYHQAWLAQLGCQISATDHPMKISKSSIPVTFYPQAWLAGLGCQISATGHRAILIKSSSDSEIFFPPSMAAQHQPLFRALYGVNGNSGTPCFFQLGTRNPTIFPNSGFDILDLAYQGNSELSLCP